jgi:hypothetical protein
MAADDAKRLLTAMPSARARLNWRAWEVTRRR